MRKTELASIELAERHVPNIYKVYKYAPHYYAAHYSSLHLLVLTVFEIYGFFLTGRYCCTASLWPPRASGALSFAFLRAAGPSPPDSAIGCNSYLWLPTSLCTGISNPVTDHHL